ncbi:MAG: chorismate-binding protein [Chlamydiia bacterium]
MRNTQDCGPCSFGSFLAFAEQEVAQHQASLLWTGVTGAASRSFLFSRPNSRLTISDRSADPWSELIASCNSDPTDPFPRWLLACTYEMGVSAQNTDPLPLPSTLAVLTGFEEVWIYHHATKRLLRVADDPVERVWRAPPPLEWARIQPKVTESLQRESRAYWERLLSNDDAEACYQGSVRQLREEILDGLFYQLNLTHEVHLPPVEHPWDCFLQMQSQQKGAMGAYVQIPEHTLMSVSPERLLRRRGTQLTTAPIKGTLLRQRGSCIDSFRALTNNPKELSELRMIIDLMRNDLGRVAIPGTVRVPRLFSIMALRHLHHLYGIVQAEVHHDLHPIEALKAVFPGGSISGCPKKSAMAAISRYEGRVRGWYTGAVAHVAPNGDMDSNLLIRTAVAASNSTSLAFGSGIVLRSQPRAEWSETLAKGRPIGEILLQNILRSKQSAECLV